MNEVDCALLAGILRGVRQPDLVVTFPSIPSQNEAVAETRRHRAAGAAMTRKWVDEGEIAALLELTRVPGWTKSGPPCFERAAVIVRVWRPDKIRRDVHNLWLKPILDGFTKANMWTDDCEAVVPFVVLAFEGVDKEYPRVEFEIYRLPTGEFS